MKTSETLKIKNEVNNLLEQISSHQMEIDICQARIKAIQTHKCKHPNETSFQSGDYSGDTYTVTNCPDCRKRRN